MSNFNKRPTRQKAKKEKKAQNKIDQPCQKSPKQSNWLFILNLIVLDCLISRGILFQVVRP